MKLSVLMIMGLLMLPMLAMGQTELDEYRWKNRLLILFFDEADALFAKLDAQLQQEQAELEDRDLVVFRLLEKGKSRVGKTVISPKEAAQLKRQLKVGEDVPQLILIGKDGGVKLRQTGSELDLEAIYPLIDSMPMRKAEMRRKG